MIGDLEFTGSDFATFGKDDPNGTSTTEKEEQIVKLAWLCSVLLSTVIYNGIFERQVKKTTKAHVLEWAHVDDLCFLVLIYENFYDKYKRVAEYRLEGKKEAYLSKEEKQQLHELCKFHEGNGISGNQGQQRMNDIKRHIVLELLNDQAGKTKLNDAFWSRVDEMMAARHNVSLADSRDEPEADLRTQQIDHINMALMDTEVDFLRQGIIAEV